MKYKVLSSDQIEHFIQHGYVVMRNAFPREVASQWVDKGFQRLGYDRHDPKTWVEPRHHMKGTTSFDVATFAPNVAAAVYDLVGGQERIGSPYTWSDAFIMNLGVGADKPWTPPSPGAGGWHKDGDFFKHFLDSPEQGILTIVCWTDMVHQGGGTFIAPDSIGVISRFLADHPEGVHPNGFGGLINECKEFIELTGNAGDVVLHHPFMLHATSQNVKRVERAITNPGVHLKEPMNFNRPNAADFSPLELAVLRGLGVERYDFKPTTPRERMDPKEVHAMSKPAKARAM